MLGDTAALNGAIGMGDFQFIRVSPSRW